MLKNILLFISLLIILSACASLDESSRISETTIRNGTPYLGIVYKKSEGSPDLRIIRLLPGPLKNSIRDKLDVNLKSYRLTRLDKHPISAKNFKSVLSEYRPGQTIRLRFESDDLSIKDKDMLELDVRLGSHEEWSGPIKKFEQRKSGKRHSGKLPIIETRNNISKLIYEKQKQLGLEQEVDNIFSLFKEWQRDNIGFHSLSRVLYSFQSPENIFELEQLVTSEIPLLKENPDKITNEIAYNLDIAFEDIKSCNSSLYNRNSLLQSLNNSHRLLSEAFSAFNTRQLKQLNENFYYLISELSQLRTPELQAHALDSINAMNASMEINFEKLLQASAELKCYLNNELVISTQAESASIPAELKNAIKGRVSDIKKQNNQWIVFGSDDDNTYDMTIIDVIYDHGGNDTYNYARVNPLNIKLVIDKSGNDVYNGSEIGAATGFLGISLISDHQGNDIYKGEIATNGVGMMGIGILVDHAGKDIYQGNYFSSGVGYYGAGVIVDLGNESDNYQSATFSQGFGGPRGFGLIYNELGNEYYRANDLSPSVYGTPAVYVSFSQGIGFGLRHYDSGGIGIIYDEHGNDRYEGGEFSQGGGYYWGLGIIHDVDGHDNYYGNRYSQGVAAHQATGILFDNNGNDQYWGMTAACQGAAWDVAIGVLIDSYGNDTYRGDGLCQGSAAMQAMGWLIDLNGTDHYTVNSNSSQGHSANNTYHFDPEKPVYSWSVLLDAGGDQDFYSNHRENNTTKHFYNINKDQPAESHVFGLFIDSELELKYYADE